MLSHLIAQNKLDSLLGKWQVSVHMLIEGCLVNTQNRAWNGRKHQCSCPGFKYHGLYQNKWLQNFELIDNLPSWLHVDLWLHMSIDEQLAWYLQLFFLMRKKISSNAKSYRKGKFYLEGIHDKATHPLEIQACFITNSFVKRRQISEPETHEHKQSQTIYNFVP